MAIQGEMRTLIIWPIYLAKCNNKNKNKTKVTRETEGSVDLVLPQPVVDWGTSQMASYSPYRCMTLGQKVVHFKGNRLPLGIWRTVGPPVCETNTYSQNSSSSYKQEMVWWHEIQLVIMATSQFTTLHSFTQPHAFKWNGVRSMAVVEPPFSHAAPMHEGGLNEWVENVNVTHCKQIPASPHNM